MKRKQTSEEATNGKRKRWIAAEKLRIVLPGVEPGVAISEQVSRHPLWLGADVQGCR